MKAVYITAVWATALDVVMFTMLCYSAMIRATKMWSSRGLEQKREAYGALYLIQKNLFSNFVKGVLAFLKKLSY